MKHSHVGHDSHLKEKVRLSPNSTVGGFSLLCEGVNMGMNSCCHQFALIPKWCMIGAGAFVKGENMKEFGVYVGVPAKRIKENTYPKKKGLV